jgi:hypothetical protein
MGNSVQHQQYEQFAAPARPGLPPAGKQRSAIHLTLVQNPPPPLAWVEQPAGWAPLVLRASLGLVGTMLAALSLWSIAPPPL